MGTQILDLPPADPLGGSESFPLIQNGATKRASVNQINDLVSASVTYTAPDAGAVTRTLVSKLHDIISVKDFGAVGDGVADDTAAVQAAIDAAAGKVLYLGENETYRFTSLSLPDNTTIISCGSDFRRISASASWAITISSNVVIDTLRYSSPGSVAKIDNGVLVNGSNVHIDNLFSLVDTVDYGSYAVRLEGSAGAELSNIKIGTVTTTNCISHFQIFYCDGVVVDSVNITSYVSGVYFRDATNVRLSGGHIKTMSPSGNGTAGQNGILVESVTADESTSNLIIEGFVVEDAPEHAIRFGGIYTICDVWLSNIKTLNSGAGGAGATGGTGIKVLGATAEAGHRHKRFHISNCSVLDVSTTGNGIGNFCGFILSGVDDIVVDSCDVGVKNNTYSCWYGIYLDSVSRATFSNCNIRYTKYPTVYFSSNDGSYPGLDNVIEKVDFTGCSFNTTGTSYTIWFAGALGVISNVQCKSCTIYGGADGTNVVRAEAVTSGSYSDTYINAVHRDPVNTAGVPPLNCGDRFLYDWTGPYYGTFGSSGANGSGFTDTTTGTVFKRLALAWKEIGYIDAISCTSVSAGTVTGTTSATSPIITATTKLGAGLGAASVNGKLQVGGGYSAFSRGVSNWTPIAEVSILTGVATATTGTEVVTLHSDRSDMYAKISCYRGAGSTQIGMNFGTSGGAAPVDRLKINPLGGINFVPMATPGTAVAGDVYYDSTSNKLRCYNGAIWNDLF